MSITAIIDAFRAAMADAGLICPNEIVPDGKLHRFKAEGSRSESCWYVLHVDRLPAGVFGDWKTGHPRSGELGRWCGKPDSEMTRADKAALESPWWGKRPPTPPA
jgi:putative DNA primase/helicase